MMRYFFYGTLMDADIRRNVIGTRRPVATRVEPAELRGFRRMAVRGAPYPTIVPASDGRVAGLLSVPLRATEEERLMRYEGASYTRRAVRITTAAGKDVAALVFMTTERARAGSQPWQFEAWRHDHKPRTLGRIRAWLSAKGRPTAQSLQPLRASDIPYHL